MTTWSEIYLSTAISNNRLDADYYKPDDLQTIGQIKESGALTLNDYCADILTGNTPKNYDEDGSFQVVRSGDLISPLIYPTCDRPFLKLSSSENCMKIEKGDVLISSIGMGSIGKISIVIDPTNLLTVSEVTILRSKVHSPEYLYTYLSSSLGQTQINREVTGATGQQHLLKSKVGSILIPKYQSDLDSRLKTLIIDAYEKQHLGQVLYEEAETILINSLGFNELDLSSKIYYEVLYSHTRSESRIDAEFFSPRMQSVLKTLSSDNISIKDVAKLSRRRFRPKSGDTFQYIEISDITKYGTANSKSILGEEAPSRATWLVKQGDIITSTVRPLRQLSAIISQTQDKFICSSGFAVLSPKNIESEILLLFLRLPLVCELLNLYSTASMYPAVSASDILNIPILLPCKQARESITEKIQQSFIARNQANDLLSKARELVEDSILFGGS